MNVFLLNLQSKAYAVIAYNGEAVEYINRYYFPTLAEDDDHYDTINTILFLMTGLAPLLWVFFGILSHAYIFPKATSLLANLSLAEHKEVKEFMNLFGKDNYKNGVENNDVKIEPIAKKKMCIHWYCETLNRRCVRIMKASFQKWQ